MADFCKMLVDNPQKSHILVAILFGLYFRIYRFEKDNYCSSVEAGTKTVMTIAVMIVLSLCLNSKSILLAVCKDDIRGIAVLIFCGITFIQLVKFTDSTGRTVFAVIRFIFVFWLSIAGDVGLFVVSFLGLLLCICLVRFRITFENIERILLVQIFLLCGESLIISICFFLSIIGDSVLDIVMLVMFSETVFFSINYTVAFGIEEHLLKEGM